jgi:hypothetical protein
MESQLNPHQIFAVRLEAYLFSDLYHSALSHHDSWSMEVSYTLVKYLRQG